MIVATTPPPSEEDPFDTEYAAWTLAQMRYREVYTGSTIHC